jgi:hypothetical protein
MVQLRIPFETSSRSGIVQGAMQSPLTRPITSLCAARFRSSFLSPPEKSETMHSSPPCLALLLSLMLLAGLSGCGSASSDNPPNPTSRANVSETPISKQETSPGNNRLTPVTQATSPLPLASVNGTGSTLGTGTVPAHDKLPVFGIPESIANDLGSPDARVRLQAMNHWESQGTQAPLDLLFAAMDDEDEVVRRKATAIIERYWDAEHEGKQK